MTATASVAIVSGNANVINLTAWKTGQLNKMGVTKLTVKVN